MKIFDMRKTENNPTVIDDKKLEINVDAAIVAINHIETLKSRLKADNVFKEIHIEIISLSISQGVLSKSFVENGDRRFKLAFYNLVRLELFEWFPNVGWEGSWKRTSKLMKLVNYTKDN